MLFLPESKACFQEETKFFVIQSENLWVYLFDPLENFTHQISCHSFLKHPYLLSVCKYFLKWCLFCCLVELIKCSSSVIFYECYQQVHLVIANSEFIKRFYYKSGIIFVYTSTFNIFIRVNVEFYINIHQI